jgi:hypothetical protein
MRRSESPIPGDSRANVPAVTAAVKQWRFKPAIADGKPVATKVSLPVKIVDDRPPLGRLATN